MLYKHFLPEAKPFVTALWLTTFSSIVIATLCFFYADKAGALVAIILTSALCAYIKSMYNYEVCFQPVQKPNKDLLLPFAYIGVFMPIACFMKAVSLFEASSLFTVVYFISALVSFLSVMSLLKIFIFDEKVKIWRKERDLFLYEKCKTDLRALYTSTSCVLDSKLQAENVEIYGNAIQSGDIKKFKEALEYFKGLKAADKLYRKVYNA